MTPRQLWRRLRSHMPAESPIDLDRHTDCIANELEKRMVIPETDKFLRRPVYERYLRRHHHMPLDPPTEAEQSDAISILKDEWLWSDEINEEAFRILDESGQ